MSESKTNEDDVKWSESNYRVEGEARDFIHEKFPVLTHQQVMESVRSAGPVKADICKYIKDKYRI